MRWIFPWWQTLIAGIALLIAAIGTYTYLAGQESSGKSFGLPIIVAGLYRVFGKWGPTGVLGIFGAVAVVRSAYQRRWESGVDQQRRRVQNADDSRYDNPWRLSQPRGDADTTDIEQTQEDNL